MSRVYEIIRRRKHDDAAEDDNAPIHRARHHGCHQWEEREYEDWEQIAEREDVDKATVAAERPAVWGQRLTADAFEQNAGDCDHVGGGEGADGKGHNGVEGGGGADVYEGEEDGDDEGDDDGVEGNVPTGCDLAFIISVCGEEEVLSMVDSHVKAMPRRVRRCRGQTTTVVGSRWLLR